MLSSVVLVGYLGQISLANLAFAGVAAYLATRLAADGTQYGVSPLVLDGPGLPAPLAALVGVSVLVPYIGAAAVTIPVAIVAYFQWGWGTDFAIVLVVYGIIQALDGNVLVPLLFSEVVNLHPIAIIVSVLVFGGLWGFWGVFFAIPLATLVNAVLHAWPRTAEPAAVAEEG